VRTDALSDLLRDVDDFSSPEHKAIFHLATGLREIDEGGPHVNHPQHVAARALEAATGALTRKHKDPA
jgi:hypothetical protein